MLSYNNLVLKEVLRIIFLKCNQENCIPCIFVIIQFYILLDRKITTAPRPIFNDEIVFRYQMTKVVGCWNIFCNWKGWENFLTIFNIVSKIDKNVFISMFDKIFQ